MFNFKLGIRRMMLPIDNFLKQIVDTVKTNQVVIVRAATGAGKTTRIPQALLQEMPGMQIFMTQNRRNAVRWNAKRIAYELGQRVGELVGFRLFGEDPQVSYKTRLTLMIDQALANMIRRGNGRLPKGILIVDEAHTRKIPIDLLLGMIKEALAVSPETRVIIMSATIDVSKFSEFFGGVPVVDVPGRTLPVDVRVKRMPYASHHTPTAGEATCEVIDQFLTGKLEVPTEDGTGTQVVTSGCGIVLLPGKEDIAAVVRQIRFEIEKHSNEAQTRVEVFECHSEIPAEEQDRILAPVQPGVFRFVVGTEILRESVTVPNTYVVVDSLQIKRPIVDARGVTHLAKIAISKSDADQGKGRTGRDVPGVYIPVSYQSEYENLRSHAVPEIQQAPITSVALQVAAIGRSIRTFPFLDAPQTEKVDIAIERLKRVGALDENERITEIGQMVVQFPIDPEFAVTYVAASKRGVLSEAIIASAVLETEGFFFRPKEERRTVLVDETTLRKLLALVEKNRWDEWEQRDTPIKPEDVDLSELPSWATRQGELFEVKFGYRDFPLGEGNRWLADFLRKDLAGSSQSDFVAAVNAYRSFKAEERRIKTLPEPKGLDEHGQPIRLNRNQMLRDWCERNFIVQKRIRMMEDTLHQISEELASSPLSLDHPVREMREFDGVELTKALATGMIDNIGVSQSRGSFNGRLGSFQLSYSSACPQTSSIVLVSGVRKIPGGRKGNEIVLADMAAPIQSEWLNEVMPQLCSRKRKGDYAYDEKLDAVFETQDNYFQALYLGSEWVLAVNQEACASTFAKWVGQSMVSEYAYPPKKTLTNPDRFLAAKAWNATYYAFAKKIAIRAGFEVLPTLNASEWTKFFLDHFPGVTRVNNIHNSDILRYPAPDAKEICEVMNANPLKFIVLEGRAECDVVYRAGNAPQVTMNFERTDLGWLELPDDGVLLPSGQRVSVTLSFSDSTGSVSDSDIPKLKEKAKEVLNLRQWYNWGESDRPAIAIPNPAEVTTVVPEIAQATYGHCVVTNAELIAFGTVVWNSGRYYQSDPLFKTEWFRELDKAVEANRKAVEKLAELQAKAAEEQRRQDLHAQAEELKSQVGTAYSTYGGNLDFAAEVRTELRDLHNKYVPSSISEIEAFIQACKAVLARVQDELAKVAEIDAKVAAGHMLRNFTAWHRRGGATNNGDGWVICPDGTRRSSDSNDVPRHKYDGNFTWRLVHENELALKWNGGTHVEVVKLPIDGPTEAQLVAVKEIEQEIGVPEGLFGFDTDILTKNEERLDAIDEVLKRVLGQIPTQGEYEGAPYYEFVDFEKGHVSMEVPERLMHKVNLANEPTGGYDRRASYVVETFPAADGVVEFHVYHKYGRWNLGILWRETSDQVAEVESVVPPQSQPKPTSPANKKQGDFTSLGNGWFRCNACNRSESFFPKKEWKALNAGEGKEVACTGCGGIAEVKK